MIAAAALTLRGVMEDRRRGRRDRRSLLDHRVYLVLVVVVVGGGQRPNHLVNLSEFFHQVTVSTLENGSTAHFIEIVYTIELRRATFIAPRFFRSILYYFL